MTGPDVSRPCRSLAFRAVALGLLALTLVGCGRARVPRPAPTRTSCLRGVPVQPDPANPVAGMVHIRGGRFNMGAVPVRREEGPPHLVKVADFWIDPTDVTNAQFARFVAATGYRTEAERPLDPAKYPQLSPAQRQPASLVFVGARGKVNLNDPSQWWSVIPGADWRHPFGPDSNIDGLGAFPVVHVAYADALAYARWLGRDLPSEAEWEYAARGGLADKRYVWGDQPPGQSQPPANTWQGVFPLVDAGRDGFKAGTSPVGCFPPNGFGLYDMAGNVWQWTTDIFRMSDARAGVEAGGAPDIVSYDPGHPDTPHHVIKGGSFLCSDEFCYRYRPAARTDGPPDGGASHIGFRTVYRGPASPTAHRP